MKGWSATETGVLVRAARQAPVYGSARPWVIEPRGRAVAMFELQHRSSSDPLGLDRLLSCGAALHNLFLAVHVIGWACTADLSSDVDEPDLLAVLRAGIRPRPLRLPSTR
jgi:hypothetical protein